MKTIPVLIIATLSLRLTLFDSSAASYTWTGGGSPNLLWSNPNNWQGLSAPQPSEQGLQLTFPNTAAPRNSTNDVLNLVLSSVVFQGANYNLYGNGANGTTMTLLGANGTDFVIVTTANNCQFGANTRLHFGSAGTFAVGSGSTLTIHSRLSGIYGFTKISPGTLTLQGALANTFTGPTTVLNGSLVLRNAGLCLPGSLTIGDGSTAYTASATVFLADQIGDSSPVTVNGNGQLLFADVNDTIGNLTLSGGFVDTANGQLTLNGDVLVQAPTNNHPSDVRGAIDLGNIGRFFNIESNAFLDISAAISGGAFGNAPAGVHKLGAGTMDLGGAGSAFGGSLYIGAGTVSFSNGAQLGAATNTTGVASNATLALGQVGFGPVVNGRKLSLAGGARVQTAFDSEWNGPVDLVSGKATFEITQTDATLVLGGALTGAGGFEKLGLGELALGGAVDNSFTGISTVIGGRVYLRKTGINTNKLAITGPLIIGEQGTSTNSPTVVVERTEVIAAPVVVNFTGSLLLSNAIETVPSLAVNSGYVTMDTNSVLMLGGPLTSTNNVLRNGLIQGQIDLGSVSRTFRVEGYPLNITAGISTDQQVDLNKIGAGRLRLGGANHFLGLLYALEGYLSVEYYLAFSDILVVTNGATLELPGDITVPSVIRLYLRGNGVNGTEGALRSIGTNIVAGDVNLEDTARIEVANPTGMLALKGHLLADHGFVKGGPGVLHLRPEGATDLISTFDVVSVQSGEMWLDRGPNSPITGGIRDTLAIGGDAGSPIATVRVLTRKELTDTSTLLVNQSGRIYFSANTTNNTRGLAGSGLIDISPNARVQTGGDVGETNEFAGTLQGGAVNETNFVKLALSHLTLSGANNLLGSTEVYGGTLWVNSAQPSARYLLTGIGVLGGNGSVNSVKLNNGTGLAPGSPYGKLHATFCTVIGNNTHTFEFHDAACDQLEMDTQPDLTKSALQLAFTPGFHPTVGQQFTILLNNTASPVIGNYANLPDGTEWRPVPTLRFRINYNVGDGNDVVLTTLTPPAPSQIKSIIFNPGLPTIITGAGLPGDTYDVEATTTLADPASWVKLGTTTAQAPGGVMFYVDQDTPNFPYRFYRFVLR